MAQVVEALRYKPGNCGFDSRWGNSLNRSGRTVAVESFQALTKIGTRSVYGGIKATGP
jgi:hypothetical protein